MKPLPHLSRFAVGAVTWAVGIALGLGLAVVYLDGSTSTALDNDAAIYEVDVTKDVTNEDLRALMRFVAEHPNRDLVLKPATPLNVESSSVRRERDQVRATAEDEQMQAYIQQGLETGLFTNESVRPACADLGKSDNAEPAIYLLCGNDLRPQLPEISSAPVKGLAEAQTRLTEYVQAVLAEAAPAQKAAGMRSSFTDAGALNELRIQPSGAVSVDFNVLIEDQIGSLHPGSSTHFMLEQLYRTLFQFRDVTRVTLTLGGSCEAFGDLIEGPCQDLDRELWEQMMQLNGDQVAYFTLKGGK